VKEDPNAVKKIKSPEAQEKMKKRLASEMGWLLQKWVLCYRNGFYATEMGCYRNRLVATEMGWLLQKWVGCFRNGIVATGMGLLI